jgi:hypothetical protein
MKENRKGFVVTFETDTTHPIKIQTRKIDTFLNVFDYLFRRWPNILTTLNKIEFEKNSIILKTKGSDITRNNLVFRIEDNNDDN